MCFTETFCIYSLSDIPWFVYVVGGIIAFGLIVFFMIAHHKNSDESIHQTQLITQSVDPTSSTPFSTQTDSYEEESSEDDEDMVLHEGDAVKYDEIGNCECDLVVKDFDEDDENTVYGYFQIIVPEGWQIINLHYDYENDKIFACVRTPENVVKELVFNTEQPDEVILSGYSVELLNYIEGVAQPSIIQQ